MSEPRLYYQRRVSAGGLADAVGAFKEDLKYLYFESEATIDLVAYPEKFSPAWTHGRAFGPKLEVRWQRVGDGFDLLLLTETDLDLPSVWQAISENEDVTPHPDSADPPSQVLLWGTHISQLERPHRLAGRQGEAWIETRIPRPLIYPVQGAPRWVKAEVIVYRYRGRPLLTRLVSLEGETNEPQPLW
jgi:hypothetical protein